MANQVVNTLGTPGGFNTPTFTPFQSGCTKCNPSNDYYNYYAQQKAVQSVPQSLSQTGGKKKLTSKNSLKLKKGGADIKIGAYSNTGNPILIPKSIGENFYVENNFNVKMDKIMKHNLGIDYATQGGSKSKNSKKNIANNAASVKELKGNKQDSKKKMKGGDIATDAMSLTNFKTKLTGGKKDKKNMRGGQETAGATPLPQRWFDPNFKERFVDSSSSEITGYNMTSSQDFATVGGNKPTKVSKKVKKDEKAIKKDVLKLKKDLMKLKKNKKSMKGGQESSGASSMDKAFYNPSTKVLDFPSKSGEGIMSAYGPIKVGDVGTGMLAPYTASMAVSANHNTMQQTGGKKKSSNKKVDGKKKSSNKKVDDKKKSSNKKVDDKKKSSNKKVDDSKKKTLSKKVDDSKKKTLSKKVGDPKKTQKGGKDTIPFISDRPVSTVTNTINGAIDGFSSFLQKLENANNNSINQIKNMKIGNQRLIQGGSKKKKQ